MSVDTERQIEGTFGSEKGILDDPKRLEHVIDLGFSTILDLSRQSGELAGHIRELSKRYAVEEYFHGGGNGDSDGTEINLEIEGPPAGMHWLIDRIVLQASGAGITEFNLYKMSEQPYNLLESATAAIVKRVFVESPPLYIPPENKLVVVALAGAGISLSFNFQARRIRRAR